MGAQYLYSWIGLHNDDNNEFEWIVDTTTTSDDDNDFDYNSLWYTNEPNDYNGHTYCTIILIIS